MDIKKGTKKNDTFAVEYGNNNDIAIKTSKGKDTLYIKGLTDLTKLKWTIDNSDVIITNTDNTDSIRLLDYFKLNGKHSLKYLKLDNTDSLVIMDNDFITNAINITSETKIRKATINGTNFNDDINADDYRLMLKGSDNIPDTVNHDRKGLTLNGGNGNDTITGTIYSDTLSGGKGANTLVFADEFGNDTVKLSKDEKLTIDLTAYGLTSIDDLKFDNSTKHLKITVPDGEEDKYGTIILENLTKKDIVGSKGYVKFKLSDTNIVDIKEVDIFDVDVDNKSLKITGTRFSETIDASGYQKATGKNNRGVIINAGAGYNTIIGTDSFNDTITGGNDGNDITAKSGNKTITTGSGADTITITGEGNRTIKAGNGENEITITGDGKNVITTGKDKDTIVIDSDTTNSINAGAGNNDITIKGSADSVIKTGNDNDTFRIEKGNELGSTQILAGGGTNTIKINNTDCWGDLTITEEKLSAINNIEFTNDLDLSPDNFVITRTGDDLIIEDRSAASSLTLNKYFINNNKKSTYNFIVNGNETSVDDFVEAVGGIEVKGKGTIKGTKYSDNIVIEGKKAVTIYTGEGNDTVNYAKGNRTIYFNEGDGHDVIEEGGGKDTLRFARGTKVTATYSSGNLVITYGTKGDTVTLPDYHFGTDSRMYYYIGNKKYAISKIDGLGITNPIKKYTETVNGTENIDTIRDITKDKRNITINALGGNDYIEGYYDTIYAGEGEDFIRAEHSTIYGEAGDDNIVATDSVIHAGTGNDKINATNSEVHADGGNNNITAINSTVYTDNGTNTIDITDSELHAGNGNDIITASSSNIYAGVGQDNIISKGNNNIYLDVDNDVDSIIAGSNDIIEFNEEVNYKFVKDNENRMVFKYCKSDLNIDELTEDELSSIVITENVTIKNNSKTIRLYSNDDNNIRIKAEDGDNLDELCLFEGNDTVQVYHYSDNPLSINMGDGNDNLDIVNSQNLHITMGKGNDSVTSWEGYADLYFNRGDGRDTINATITEDTQSYLSLVFDCDYDDLSITSAASNVYISGYGDDTDTVIIAGYNTNTKQETIIIKTNDGVNGLNNNGYIYGTDGDDNINGTSNDDTILALKGNDTIHTNSGNNNVYLYSGNNRVYCGNGNNTIEGGSGNDYVEGGSGNDRIVVGKGTENIIYGGAGNDTIVTALGTGNFYGGTGNDTYDIMGIIPCVIEDSYELNNNDTLKIWAQPNELAVYFDLSIDEEGNKTYGNDLFFSSIANFGKKNESIKIVDQFVEGKSIETIKSWGDTVILDTVTLNLVKQDVATWLSNSDYTSTQDVINSQDTTAIASMLQAYTGLIN